VTLMVNAIALERRLSTMPSMKIDASVGTASALRAQSTEPAFSCTAKSLISFFRQ